MDTQPSPQSDDTATHAPVPVGQRLAAHGPPVPGFAHPHQALDVTGSAVWEWDIPHDRLTTNRHWHDLLATGHTETPGTLADYRRCFHPDDAQAIEAGLAQALGSKGQLHAHTHRLITRQGQVIWVHARTQVVETGGQGEPLCVVGSLTDISALKQAQEAVHRLAFFDPLTHLGNRQQLKAHLQQHLGACQAQGRQGALLLMDVDHFKMLNDTQGHDVGDQCLVQLAAHIRHTAGTALVARTGGDEFAVLPDTLFADSEAAMLAASTLASALLGTGSTHLHVQGQLYRATLSIGVALFGAAQDTHDTVMRNADLAMHEAKRSGRNGVRFFDAHIQQLRQRRTQLQTELQQALQTGQLRLAYQPLVDAQQRCVGLEALVRWAHPEHGLMLPGCFIDLAEETGQIEGIGRYVLERVCLDLALWQLDPQRQHWTVGVNVSVRQFNRPHFAEEVLAVLQRTGAPAKMLKLEITESLLLKGTGQVLDTIHRLRDAGVLFSVDDFGTGYSSLAYLQNLPIDELKIDQSFVRPLNNKAGGSAIVNTILTLARELGLRIVAEGVETTAQFDTLHALGCECFQGYLFGRPELIDHPAPGG